MTLNQAFEILSDKLHPNEFKEVRQNIREALKFKDMSLDDLENVVEEILENYRM